MELLFVFVAGAIIGILARYCLPGRHMHGSMLVPALGAAFACALWAVLTWAGLAWNGGWIWWITILGTVLVTVVVDLALARSRHRADADRLATLSHTGLTERA